MIPPLSRFLARIETARDSSEGSKDSTDSTSYGSSRNHGALLCLVWAVGLIEGDSSKYLKKIQKTCLVSESRLSPLLRFFQQLWAQKAFFCFVLRLFGRSRLHQSTRQQHHFGSGLGLLALPAVALPLIHDLGLSLSKLMALVLAQATSQALASPIWAVSWRQMSTKKVDSVMTGRTEIQRFLSYVFTDKRHNVSTSHEICPIEMQNRNLF